MKHILDPIVNGLKTLLMVFGIFYASEYFFNYNLALGRWPTVITIFVAILVAIDIIRLSLGYPAPLDFIFRTKNTK